MTREDAAHLDLLRSIGSFEALQIVLALAQEPERPVAWDALRVLAPGLRDLEDDVADLERAGLVTVTQGTVALRDDPAVRSAATALLRAYRSDPLPIVQRLTGSAIERMRSAAVRTFADAFVVRRRS